MQAFPNLNGLSEFCKTIFSTSLAIVMLLPGSWPWRLCLGLQESWAHRQAG